MNTAPRPSPRRIVAKTRPTASDLPNSTGHEPVDPRWAWHHKTLTHLRDRLLAAHAEHAAAVADAPETIGYESADTAREELDRDILWVELGAENDCLAEIDAALNRIRNGTYGICEASGEPIAAARLRVIPWTRYCHDAAEAAEKRRRAGKGISL